ncbi:MULTISPECIES: Flp family type IVb pilin [unclassified Mesorhizobium]|uniref:Flp family type IVb pilin n=1 Tax=unclassified Mesorhizobium TaxID=325217 RepID=UPI0010918AD7|nr:MULTISPECIES: Flp family type IVb pilin [unclassified Mesorhizobium]TIS97777.1 MAG: Flp family type IVb pilin [Mesorhizobium sp.]TGP92578.1 Flp family type IVb pilin [Mesorhizobium sp. M8A.F.Ca.ET.218.01.1.1]TGQ79911.1 Flp family type IVb pilin [Mesorhizobium sp. M8A.F.Ca.ET.207.01.1.1]TGQ90936.1 Flp family type IVb pilin [Mesorhizobium sp. M8A.F.Ca.ET.208.01.1.1]TGT17396.1 Flp family type IVb pilin [Mesorhizobium sp. M8A.F.Ca.ET.213.01.1.1]
MKRLIIAARQFRDDENGAAMVEYSILIGIIAAASIIAVIAIGGWVGSQFTGLCANLNGKGLKADGSAGGTC